MGQPQSGHRRPRDSWLHSVGRARSHQGGWQSARWGDTPGRLWGPGACACVRARLTSEAFSEQLLSFPSIPAGKEWEDEAGLGQGDAFLSPSFHFPFLPGRPNISGATHRKTSLGGPRRLWCGCRTGWTLPPIHLSAAGAVSPLGGAGIFCYERDCLVWSLFSLYHKNDRLFSLSLSKQRRAIWFP